MVGKFSKTLVHHCGATTGWIGLKISPSFSEPQITLRTKLQGNRWPKVDSLVVLSWNCSITHIIDNIITQFIIHKALMIRISKENDRCSGPVGARTTVCTWLWFCTAEKDVLTILQKTNPDFFYKLSMTFCFCLRINLLLISHLRNRIIINKLVFCNFDINCFF